jgi:hypothetical protein
MRGRRLSRLPVAKDRRKLVSYEEYAHLVGGRERVAGRSGRWKAIGIIVTVIALWTLLSNVVPLPEWGDSLVIAAIVSLRCPLGFSGQAPLRGLALIRQD